MPSQRSGSNASYCRLEKIFLKAGESKKVSFKITPELLKFYNYNLDFVCESGDFEVMIGRNSQDVKKAAFKLL